MAASTLVAPSFLWVPEHSTSLGEECADLAVASGVSLDDEQRLALDVVLATKSDGRWAAFEAAVIAARQNLKTHIFKAVGLGSIYLFDDELVVWTAHEFNTAMEAFRDVVEILDGAPHLSRRVRKVVYENGSEGIEFHSGQRWRFKARTKAGGRGLTGNRVFLDEAFALQPSHMGSLMPTMSAQSVSGNPQILYGSSAGQLQSGVLRSLRDRGRRGGDPSLAYLEWGDPDPTGCEQDRCNHTYGTKGCVLDDIERWRLANPALERRISIDFVGAERRSLPPEEFARERLGWWEDPVDGDSGIPLTEWQACADRSAEILDPPTLAFDVSPGLVSGSIVACGGALHVVEHGRGTSWLVDRLVELRDKHQPSAIGVDPSGPAGALIPDCEKAGLTVRSKANPSGDLVLLSGTESMQACGGFLGGVLEHTLVHRDEHALNAAVAGAGRRQVGDAWKWSRRDSTADITPLVAATVARFLWSGSGSGESDFFTI